MIDVQRHAALALLGVLQGRSLTVSLEQLWRRHPDFTPAQRGGIQDLAYGSCRWLGTLRAVLARLLRAPLTDPDVEALLLIALYQLHYTRGAPHAVVDNAVRNCIALRKASAKGLVNAVLRNFQRQADALLVAAHAQELGRYSYPQWWTDALRARWPDDFAAILDAGNLHPPMTLRVNQRRTSVDAYAQSLRDAEIAARRIGESALSLDKPIAAATLPGFADGLVSVQDLGAQFAAPLLAPRDGERVLDACAAPGGKTAHLLERADIDLLALDRDALRMQRVTQNLERLRLRCTTKIADAGDLDAWWNGTPFDRILLDAPCTASGVVRRHPDIKWLRREGDIAQLSAEQARLLRVLWQTLVSGGTLLYVTCSVFVDETQAQIDAFLRDNDDARPMRLNDFPGQGGQLLPDTEHDGFFYALLTKQPASRPRLDA